MPQRELKNLHSKPLGAEGCEVQVHWLWVSRAEKATACQAGWVLLVFGLRASSCWQAQRSAFCCGQIPAELSTDVISRDR